MAEPHQISASGRASQLPDLLLLDMARLDMGHRLPGSTSSGSSCHRRSSSNRRCRHPRSSNSG